MEMNFLGETTQLRAQPNNYAATSDKLSCEKFNNGHIILAQSVFYGDN